MVSLIFFNFRLETKFSIQLGLRQFLFEVNRISIRGEILKKLCASRPTSKHISEKPCFRLRQKNIQWPTFVSSFSTVYRVSIRGGYPHRSILHF